MSTLSSEARAATDQNFSLPHRYKPNISLFSARIGHPSLSEIQKCPALLVFLPLYHASQKRHPRHPRRRRMSAALAVDVRITTEE